MPAASAITQEPALGGAGGSAAKALNPDISMIGDFIGSAGHNPVNPTSSFQMHESELGVQAIIDPYARGDFFLSFGEQGVNLEEGYITLTALPAGLVAKVGKFRGAFGKVNTLHNHVLPWIDRPLVSNHTIAGAVTLVATKNRIDSSPVVAGEKVYFGSSDGHLYVVNLADGKQVQKIELGRSIIASAAVSQGRLVIGTTDGHLYCLGKK